jgi:hypothetical protein
MPKASTTVKLRIHVELGTHGKMKMEEEALERTEPVFLKVYGAQESIPRNEFRQPL